MATQEYLENSEGGPLLFSIVAVRTMSRHLFMDRMIRANNLPSSNDCAKGMACCDPEFAILNDNTGF